MDRSILHGGNFGERVAKKAESVTNSVGTLMILALVSYADTIVPNALP